MEGRNQFQRNFRNYQNHPRNQKRQIPVQPEYRAPKLPPHIQSALLLVNSLSKVIMEGSTKITKLSGFVNNKLWRSTLIRVRHIGLTDEFIDNELRKNEKLEKLLPPRAVRDYKYLHEDDVQLMPTIDAKCDEISNYVTNFKLEETFALPIEKRDKVMKAYLQYKMGIIQAKIERFEANAYSTQEMISTVKRMKAQEQAHEQ